MCEQACKPGGKSRAGIIGPATNGLTANMEVRHRTAGAHERCQRCRRVWRSCCDRLGRQDHSTMGGRGGVGSGDSRGGSDERRRERDVFHWRERCHESGKRGGVRAKVRGVRGIRRRTAAFGGRLGCGRVGTQRRAPPSPSPPSPSPSSSKSHRMLSKMLLLQERD